MKRILVAALFAAAFIAGPASAQGISAHSFYVGGHVGQAKAKGACDDVSGPGITCDDNDTSFRILGGYQLNKNFAAEAAYTDFGKVQARGPGGTASVKSHALELVGVGTLPVGDRFGVYGKVGVYHASSEGSVNTVLLTGTTSDDNTDLTFGGGVAFDLTRQVTLRGEWQRYNDVGGDNVGKGDVDVISLGVLFRF